MVIVCSCSEMLVEMNAIDDSFFSYSKGYSVLMFRVLSGEVKLATFLFFLASARPRMPHR